MSRQILPNKRHSYNFTLSFKGEKYDVTVGHYPDGTIGETFVNRIRDKTAAKLGEQLDGICRDSAILLSFAIQHGASLPAIRKALTRNDDNEPSTIVGALVDTIWKQQPPQQPAADLPDNPRRPGPQPQTSAGELASV